MAALPLTTDPAGFTAIITGFSPTHPLSKAILEALNSSIPDTTPLSLALLSPTDTDQSFVPPSTYSNITILPLQCDITSPESIGRISHQIRAKLGAWDLFIHNAPDHVTAENQHDPASVRGSDEDTWWGVFERNVRSLQPVARHFFSKMKRGATFVNVLPAAVVGDGVVKGGSAESAAAVAAGRVVEYIARENAGSQVRFVNVGVERVTGSDGVAGVDKVSKAIVEAVLKRGERGESTCDYLNL